MKLPFYIVLVCTLVFLSTRTVNARTTQGKPRGEQHYLVESSNFREAEMEIGLCEILHAASTIYFHASTSGGVMTITARLPTLNRVDELNESIASVPYIESNANPKIESRSDGNFEVSYSSQVAMPPLKAGGARTELPRAYLNPIATVNQAGLDSGLVFEKFWPSAQVDVGLYKLTTVQFAVSGTCEQFVSMLKRLGPHADVIGLESNQLIFESELPRPLRWTATLKLKSQR